MLVYSHNNFNDICYKSYDYTPLPQCQWELCNHWNIKWDIGYIDIKSDLLQSKKFIVNSNIPKKSLYSMMT